VSDVKPLSKSAYAKKLARAIRKADRWFNKYIVLRDKKCVICGSEENGQCSHYYGKKACPELRYDLDNAHRMCSACHLRHHKFDDQMYSNWMRHTYSERKLDRLEEASKMREDRPIEYYEGIEKKYKELVERMGD
jgi:hypothetical protein